MADAAVAAQSNPEQKIGLRRDFTTWGSYTCGYADVGVDIYAALGSDRGQSADVGGGADAGGVKRMA